MDQPGTGDAPATSARPDAPARQDGWLTRKFAGFYRSRDTIKAHPLWGTLFALLAVILGAAVHEGYDYAKRKIMGPDSFLVQMRDEQKQAFGKLQENLDRLTSAVDSKDRDALRAVQGSVKTLESNNQKLLDQLVMAKRENDNLRRIAEQRAGISGGYDFILAGNNGVRIDPTTVLGLRYVGAGYAEVSLTSSDKQQFNALHSGESLSFTNAKGQPCKVSVLGIDRDADSASFALGCSS